MVLKEAYRYQNYLESLISNLELTLSDADLVTSKKELHMLNKADSRLKDEHKELNTDADFSFTANDLLDAGVKLISEKQKLSDAIAKAKKSTEIDIDAAMSMNKTKQAFVSTLERLDRFKDSERETIAHGYTINNEGNQVDLRYTLKTITEINFDRNSVKGLIKKFKKETNEISTKKDVIDLTTTVDYEPFVDVDTVFEDAILELVG